MLSLSRCKNPICPVDEGLGLMSSKLTRLVAKLATHMMADCKPSTTKAILDQIGDISPSVSTLLRFIVSVHDHFQNIEEEILSEVQVSNDCIIIPQK